MSSFLCFLCHSTVNADTNEEIREKYREVVGMHLCMDSHLCYICCHVLNKLWLFRAVCLKRSLEYPVLFSEKGTLNLQRNDLEIHAICSDDICGQFHNRNVHSKSFHISYEDTNTTHSQEGVDSRYVKLEDDRTDFEDYFHQEEPISNKESVQENNIETYDNYTRETPTNITNEDERHVNVNSDYQNVDTDIQTNNRADNFETDNVETNYSETDIAIEEEEVNNDEHIVEDLENNEEIDLKNNKEIEPEELNKKKKSKKSKKKGFEKIVLSLEEQKAELDKRRREKKYIEAEFKCYNCALPFLFKDSYQAHMMRHEESNGEYRCATCTLRFASPGVLRAHLAHHAERYACSRCATRVRPRARVTHTRNCWGVKGEVACHLCGGMFQDGAGLQQHLKRFHQTNASSRTYSCGVCGSTYGNQAAVRTHMIKHINKKFECTECQSTFSSPYTLTQHKKHKHGGLKREFYCETCSIAYSSRKSLLAHKRNALNHQQTVFECPICGRISPNRRSLSSHIESVHSNTKNYCCPLCPNRYSNRKSLVRHIGSHQGKRDAKSLLCHLCAASFKGRNKLNRHLREVCEKNKLEEEYARL